MPDPEITEVLTHNKFLGTSSDFRSDTESGDEEFQTEEENGFF